jgi:hypothetical protein
MLEMSPDPTCDLIAVANHVIDELSMRMDTGTNPRNSSPTCANIFNVIGSTPSIGGVGTSMTDGIDAILFANFLLRRHLTDMLPAPSWHTVALIASSLAIINLSRTSVEPSIQNALLPADVCVPSPRAKHVSKRRVDGFFLDICTKQLSPTILTSSCGIVYDLDL